MPLYVNDDEADALARKLQHLLGAKTKSAAVKQALANELSRIAGRMPLRERLARVKEKARAIAPPNPAFDQKRFTDEMWGDL